MPSFAAIMSSACMLLAATTASSLENSYDDVIAAAQARAAANREGRIRSWAWPPVGWNAEVSPPDLPAWNGNGDNCFMPITGILFANENQTAVALAQAMTPNCTLNFRADTYNYTFCSATACKDARKCAFGPRLEHSLFVRPLALFDETSHWVQRKQVASWTPANQDLVRKYFYDYLSATVTKYPQYASDVWKMWGSENIDASGQITTYIAADVLSKVPQYANLSLPDGRTIAEHAAAWESFFYSWLKERATRGVFIELGSTGYWARTWPNVFNLVDLPSSGRVRQRAKMFADIAMLEAEQASIAGVRAGQKSRCKKGGFGHGEGLHHNMYPAVTPQLLGTNMTHWTANNTLIPPSNRIIGAEAGTYEIGNVSILAHVLGKAPDTKGTYLMRNRMIGQIEVQQSCKTKPESCTCSNQRCAETLRPPKCICPAGPKTNVMLTKSDQVHTIWHTPSYAIGGVVFSPNDWFGANTQQRWTGMVFSNVNHSAIGLPHLTGEVSV